MVDMDKMNKKRARARERAAKKAAEKSQSVDWNSFAEYEGNGDLVGLAHEGRLVHETDAAILIIHDGEELWMPKSQIAEGDDEALMITAWIADQKGLDAW